MQSDLFRADAEMTSLGSSLKLFGKALHFSGEEDGIYGRQSGNRRRIASSPNKLSMEVRTVDSRNGSDGLSEHCHSHVSHCQHN
jgi:hypothetical protein